MVKSDHSQVFLPVGTFSDQFLKRLAQYSDRIALVDGINGHEITYAELIMNIKTLAIGLNRLGLKKGDIVSLYCPNSFEYVYFLFAVMINGASAANVNPTYTPYELQNAINLTRSNWWVTTRALSKNLLEILKDCKVKVQAIILIDKLDDDNDDEGYTSFISLLSPPTPLSTLDNFSEIFSGVHINPLKDPAIVLFSSGTMGLPKAVLLSHYNFVFTTTMLTELIGDNDPDHGPGEQPITMSVLPFFHIYGLVWVLMMSLYFGHKLIILPRFLPNETFKCIELYKVTVFPLVPTLVNYMVKNQSIKEKYDLSSLRRIFCGASPLTEQTEFQFKSIYNVNKLHQGYGMTETCLVTLHATPNRPCKKGSVGHPIPNSEVVVRCIETGRDLGPFEKGEICLKGPQVMLGYLNNKEATDEAVDKDGWLHTGDIGYYDDEGYFFIIDRIKELIKCKGFQVPPAELESLLFTHPSVEDCAVIGIPDYDHGEIPKAFVVKKQGCDVTADEIIDFVASKMSHYKHLKGGVEFIQSIPKSEAGKILRRKLRKIGNSKL